MSGRSPARSEARDAYDTFAAVYEDFNHAYQYERWTARLLAAAQRNGLRGRRLLDVGCGTGLSFTPMLTRGWRVVACDISPAMLEIARAKVGVKAELLVADMCELPRLGEFDLVWAVNDAVNYLLGDGELQDALAGMRRNLAAGGLVVFDSNTLAAYRGFFSRDVVVENGGRRFVWRGQMAADALAPGAVSESRFEAEGEEGLSHVHRQRHFTEAEVLEAIAGAGLRCLEVLGESGGELRAGLDDLVDTKAVYVCGLRSACGRPESGRDERRPSR